MYRLIIVVIFLSGNLAFPAKEATNQNAGNLLPNGGQTKELYNLGRIGNKFYFINKGIMNWTQSKSYCASHGMTMASIDTVEESEFLKSKYQSGVFDGWFWTAARDAHTLQQFMWDDNESNISVSLPTEFAPGAENRYQTCGGYHISSNTSATIMFLSCSTPNGYSFCESE